jgi:outer membrane murein-binding lipoprotein Lpp
MQNHRRPGFSSRVLVTIGALLLSSSLARGQSAPSTSSTEVTPDLKSLAASVRQLQSQVRELNSQNERVT